MSSFVLFWLDNLIDFSAQEQSQKYNDKNNDMPARGTNAYADRLTKQKWATYVFHLMDTIKDYYTSIWWRTEREWNPIFGQLLNKISSFLKNVQEGELSNPTDAKKAIAILLSWLMGWVDNDLEKMPQQFWWTWKEICRFETKKVEDTTVSVDEEMMKIYKSSIVNRFYGTMMILKNTQPPAENWEKSVWFFAQIEIDHKTNVDSWSSMFWSRVSFAPQLTWWEAIVARLYQDWWFLDANSKTLSSIVSKWLTQPMYGAGVDTMDDKSRWRFVWDCTAIVQSIKTMPSQDREWIVSFASNILTKEELSIFANVCQPWKNSSAKNSFAELDTMILDKVPDKQKKAVEKALKWKQKLLTNYEEWVTDDQEWVVYSVMSAIQQIQTVYVMKNVSPVSKIKTKWVLPTLWSMFTHKEKFVEAWSWKDPKYKDNKAVWKWRELQSINAATQNECDNSNHIFKEFSDHVTASTRMWWWIRREALFLIAEAFLDDQKQKYQKKFTMYCDNLQKRSPDPQHISKNVFYLRDTMQRMSFSYDISGKISSQSLFDDIDEKFVNTFVDNVINIDKVILREGSMCWTNDSYKIHQSLHWIS